MLNNDFGKNRRHFQIYYFPYQNNMCSINIQFPFYQLCHSPNKLRLKGSWRCVRGLENVSGPETVAGSVASRGLPWPPVASRCLPWPPVASRGLPRPSWPPVASRGLSWPLVASRGFLWLLVASRGLYWFLVASRDLSVFASVFVS